MSENKPAELKVPHKASDARNSDIALIRELAHLLAETELTEIEIAEGDKRFKVKREVTVAQYAAAPAYMSAPAAAAPAAASAAAPAAAADAHSDAMTSPMVGTAYLAPKPGDPAFIKIGDSVKEGQTVMIIEAMKVMNPIKATKSGTVSAILVKDSEPVEFGQKLLVIG